MKIDKFKIISELALFAKKGGNINDAAKTIAKIIHNAGPSQDL